MVTYGFYTDIYQGCLLGESEFSPLARRAEQILARYERIYQVDCPGEDSRAMAVCAMAETLKQFGRQNGVLSTSVGGVSVRYEDDSCRRLSRELYRQASIFLNIRREVG